MQHRNRAHIKAQNSSFHKQFGHKENGDVSPFSCKNSNLMKSDGFLEPNMGESVLSCYGKIILW